MPDRNPRLVCLLVVVAGSYLRNKKQFVNMMSKFALVVSQQKQISSTADIN